MEAADGVPAPQPLDAETRKTYEVPAASAGKFEVVRPRLVVADAIGADHVVPASLDTSTSYPDGVGPDGAVHDTLICLVDVRTTAVGALGVFGGPGVETELVGAE
jgi:hypothetical protein